MEMDDMEDDSVEGRDSMESQKGATVDRFGDVAVAGQKTR
jgi:hypothetical protein